MNKKFYITINRKKILASQSETILKIAQKNGFEIPSLCYHSDLTPKQSCGLCLVKIKGIKDLQKACVTEVKPDMEITTDSLAIKKARQKNLEKIFNSHAEECYDCVWNYHCQLLELVKKIGKKKEGFIKKEKKQPVYQFGPALIYDSQKCFGCENCVEVCENQSIGFLEKKVEKDKIKIVPSQDPRKQCVYCGQCLIHCPAGAFEGVGEFEDVEKPLSQKNKIVVFQIAPAVRTALGEEFDLPLGISVLDKIVDGLKKLGADKVFDVSVGADFTTLEAENDLNKKLKDSQNFCIFSSCCPSWVRFVELYFPEYISNLAQIRSPQIILGGLIKTYWAKKQKINSKDIFVVSVMPCVAKKYEITRPEIMVNGFKPVDYVLTTRGLAQLFKKNKIDLKNLKGEELDNPFNAPSGAGIIYGISGGVTEAMVRINTHLKGEKKDFLKIKKINSHRKEIEFNVNKRILKMAIIDGLGEARKVLQEMKKEPGKYQCLEVMACSGGCLGGGGQPLPTNELVREKRKKGLLGIDRRSNNKKATQNKIVKIINQEFLKNLNLRKKVFRVDYFSKRKNK